MKTEEAARRQAAQEKRENADRLLEKAQREKEILAAEEAQRKAARRKALEPVAQRSNCVIKPVMSQADLEARR